MTRKKQQSPRHYYVEGVRFPPPPMEEWSAEELEQYMAACKKLDPLGKAVISPMNAEQLEAFMKERGDL